MHNPGLKTGASKPFRLFGMLARKERWGLSMRGRLAAGALSLALAWLMLIETHPFLAVTDRVDANYLVMEGWVHMFAAQTTAAEFRSGKYRGIFVTGSPVKGSGDYDKDSNTEAWVGADLLLRAGIPEGQLQRIARRQVDRDRTYGSALELKTWIQEHHPEVHAINVLTEDAHARRTRLLFQEALGPDIKVGVIAAPNPDYDPHHWWRYSEGVREITGETIAYLYAKFLFWPEKHNNEDGR
jgi:uncharacterized SAM-binding protein YcdF (DUF218 family)